MTLTVPTRLGLPGRRRFPIEKPAHGPGDAWGWLTTLCAALAFTGLGYALMHSGGRDRGATEIAILLAAPSLLAARAWRRVPAAELIVSSAVAVASVLVPLITPLGDSATGDLNAYGYAAVLYLAVRSLARNGDVRRLVTIALLSIAVVESTDVWRVWIGEHNAHFQVVGTFYWHNQFGIYAAATALLAACLVMRSRQMEDAIAWLVAPVFGALVLMSQSRGALLSLVIAGAALVGISLVRRQWLPLLRLAVVAGLAIAVHVGFTAAVTDHGGSSNTTAASNPDFSPGRTTLEATSVFRVSAGEEAARVFARDPFLSHGYGSLGVTGWRNAPAGATTSPYAHSAELQALSDGGLLLGLPVVVALGLMAWTALRSTFRATRKTKELDWPRLGVSLAAIAMLVHTSMDFDTQYPVLAALLVVFVALAAQPVAEVNQASGLGWRRAAVAVTAAAALLSTVLVAAYWQTTDRLSTAGSRLSSDSATSVAVARHALRDHIFKDPRPARFIVVAADLGYVFDDATLQQALRESRTYPQLDPSFGPIWARVNAEVLAASPPSGPTTTRG